MVQSTAAIRSCSTQACKGRSRETHPKELNSEITTKEHESSLFGEELTKNMPSRLPNRHRIIKVSQVKCSRTCIPAQQFTGLRLPTADLRKMPTTSVTPWLIAEFCDSATSNIRKCPALRQNKPTRPEPVPPQPRHLSKAPKSTTHRRCSSHAGDRSMSAH